VFLLGHWKNYEELEESLSMPELMTTLEAMHKKEERDKEFQASLQNVTLETKTEEGKSFEDIQRKAAGIETSADDIVSLQGQFAAQAGFGIGMGLGYNKI